MAGNPPSPADIPGPADSPRTAHPVAPLALYRRYRPASFAEVKGQDQVTEPLRQALRSGRVHHAYLFSGPRGCGKTSSARILARSLNCEQGPTPDPCGVCPSCVALAPAGPGSIDVIEIDAASHGGVDDARDLRERAFYAPVSGRFKIYIIDEAHMVTREGFNALLKLVEEPPPHLKFVFATTEPEKVIATIRSRTHHYPFRLVPPAVLREHLEQILASEGVPYEPAVLPIVIRAGAGSVRDALSVLDQLIAGSDEGGLRYDRAVALLGYTDDRLLDEVVEAFAAGDGAAVFHAIDHVVEAGHDPRRFAADLLDRLRDLIILLAVPDAGSSGLIDAPADRLDRMRAQAGKFGQAALTRAAEGISAGLVEMRGATSPRLLLELMCAQVLLPPAGPGDAALVGRLDRLERRLGAQRPAEPGPDRPDGQVTVPSASAPEPRAARPQPRPESAEPPAARSDRQEGSRAQQAAPPRSTGQPREATPPPSPSGPLDTATVRTRWPEVLGAVQQAKRVAWMQLSNAEVESFEDGVLTLAFAQAGVAKGFISGGYEKDLAQVLTSIFGVSPRIATTLGGGVGKTSVNTGTGQSGQAAVPPAPPAGGQQQAGPRRGRARNGDGAVPGPSASAGHPAPVARMAEEDPDPGDQPAGDVLTGMDLIERELGGRVIEEIDGP
jgi:DNA polymerase-3 subunit gamma/tau